MTSARDAAYWALAALVAAYGLLIAQDVLTATLVVVVVLWLKTARERAGELDAWRADVAELEERKAEALERLADGDGGVAP